MVAMSFGSLPPAEGSILGSVLVVPRLVRCQQRPPEVRAAGGNRLCQARCPALAFPYGFDLAGLGAGDDVGPLPDLEVVGQRLPVRGQARRGQVRWRLGLPGAKESDETKPGRICAVPREIPVPRAAPRWPPARRSPMSRRFDWHSSVAAAGRGCAPGYSRTTRNPGWPRQTSPARVRSRPSRSRIPASADRPRFSPAASSSVPQGWRRRAGNCVPPATAGHHRRSSARPRWRAHANSLRSACR